jgi:hypothetical protein
MNDKKNKKNIGMNIRNLLSGFNPVTGVIGLGFFIIFLIYILYYDTFVSKDRSIDYHVKIISSELDESQVATLGPQSFSYLAIIDAGSSGCRAHVYKYGKLGRLEGPLYIVPQHQSYKVKPGLSSFANNPAGSEPSLKKLIVFMKSQIPENMWQDTPIWLKATAGLRLLEKSQSDSVVLFVRNFFSDKINSPFLFHPSHVAIISGKEEGAFGWIAFNYLKKVIGPKKKGNVLPYAVVEMGGASTQVLFITLLFTNSII